MISALKRLKNVCSRTQGKICGNFSIRHWLFPLALFLHHGVYHVSSKCNLQCPSKLKVKSDVLDHPSIALFSLKYSNSMDSNGKWKHEKLFCKQYMFCDRHLRKDFLFSDGMSTNARNTEKHFFQNPDIKTVFCICWRNNKMKCNRKSIYISPAN